MSPLPFSDPEHNERTSQLADAYANTAENIGVDYLNVFDDMLHDDVWMGAVRANDEVHPVARGYERLAQEISDWSAWKQWTQ